MKVKYLILLLVALLFANNSFCMQRAGKIVAGSIPSIPLYIATRFIAENNRLDSLFNVIQSKAKYDLMSENEKQKERGERVLAESDDIMNSYKKQFPTIYPITQVKNHRKLLQKVLDAEYSKKNN